MSSERRRSARLIESPWVYNMPKRGPVYVDLDEDGGGSFEGLHNPVRKLQKLQVQNPSAGGTESGSDIAVNHGNLELRSEWEMGNGSQVAQDSEEEDDFVTPAEHFEKTKPISKHTVLRKKFNVKSAESETEKRGKTTGKRIRETEHECFCDWISTYNLPKFSEIVKLRPRVVRLGWQSNENSVDCGIFTMRHMETFMGMLLAWRTGIRTDNQKSVLNKLRVVYGHKILTWQNNSKKDLVMRGATYLAKGKKIVE